MNCMPSCIKYGDGMFFYRIILTFCLLCSGLCAWGQDTPVETLIQKYEDVSGARSFVAQGLKMMLARRILSQTPVASIASDVEILYVLKMEGVSQGPLLSFVSDLHEALQKYEYYGTLPSKNGKVDVYLMYSDSETVEELVIYNPSIYSLNSLYGSFPIHDLLDIRDEMTGQQDDQTG